MSTQIMRNQITIRRAHKGYVMTTFSTDPVVTKKIEDEKLRYAIHPEPETVGKAVDRAIRVIESVLKE